METQNKGSWNFRRIIGVIEILLGITLMILPLFMISEQYGHDCSAEKPVTTDNDPAWFNYMDCSLTSDVQRLAQFTNITSLLIGSLFILQGIVNLRRTYA